MTVKREVFNFNSDWGGKPSRFRPAPHPPGWRGRGRLVVGQLPQPGKTSYSDFWLRITSSEISACASVPFLTWTSTGAAFFSPDNRHERQLKSWQRHGRYTVTQPGMAALNSILGKAAFVKRQTMVSSVEGTQVDFHLLSDTRYPPFLCVWFEDKLFYLKAFLNMSRGRNVTHGRAISPKIFQSPKNFWDDISSHFSKAD